MTVVGRGRGGETLIDAEDTGVLLLTAVLGGLLLCELFGDIILPCFSFFTGDDSREDCLEDCLDALQ